MTNFEKKNINQIIKIGSKNAFVEFLDSAFQIGKVMIRFAEYDLSKPEGQRFTKEVVIYIDIEEFENLAHDIKFRFIDRKSAEARRVQEQGGYKFAREIYTDMGGTTVASLAKQGRPREDNKPESRLFKIYPGAKFPWLMQAEKGAGKTSETGLIAPDGKPDEIIRMPMEDKDFRKVAIAVDNEIQSWKVYNRFVKEKQMANNRGKYKAS